MTPALGMFLLFVLVTLGITYWAARRSHGAAAFFTASRRITGWQNGVAERIAYDPDGPSRPGCAGAPQGEDWDRAATGMSGRGLKRNRALLRLTGPCGEMA